MPPALTPLTRDEATLWEAFQTYRSALGWHGDRSLWWGFRQFLRRWPLEQWPEEPAWHFGDLTPKEQPVAIFLLATNRWHPGYAFLLGGTFTSLRRSLEVTPWAEDLNRVMGIATRLGLHPRTRDAMIVLACVRLLVQTGCRLNALTEPDCAAFEEAIRTAEATANRTLPHYFTALQDLRQVLYHGGILAQPPRHRRQSTTPWDEFLADLPDPMRTTMVRYLTRMQALRRPATIRQYANAFRNFGHFLREHPTPVTSIADLTRSEHIEPWMIWNATRPAGRVPGQPAGHQHQKSLIVCFKIFLDALMEWAWDEAPSRPLLYRQDLPTLDETLPRGLSESQDRDLMTTIRNLSDPCQRAGLIILRQTGIRIGELRLLTVNCVENIAGQGAWLHVPLGKLHTERMVPLDADTVAVIEAVARERETIRPLPHPESGILTEFLFVRHGKLPGPEYFRDGLHRATQDAHLCDAGGQPLIVTPHMLRHTYATRLVNAGLSVPALMKLLGHRSAEMTLRYGHIYDSTVRAAWEVASERQPAFSETMIALPMATAPGTASTSVADWMGEHQLKTRLAHGYCLRALHQQACPYANICEHCAAFVPLPDAHGTLTQELEDIRLLKKDAHLRNWPTEIARHQSTIERLEGLLAQLPVPEVKPRRRRS